MKVTNYNTLSRREAVMSREEKISLKRLLDKVA
jgi:hypothetical protein